MNSVPQDQPSRDQAILVDHSFIVQAPAGSGKTGLLTQRFLALLATVNAPEEILAITFTRKATAEMKQRIFEALESAKKPAPAEDYLLKTWQLAKEVLRRDAEKNWDLLLNLSRLRILTFDGLSAALVKQLPILSGLGGNVTTSTNNEYFYQQAAKNTVALLFDEDFQNDLTPLLNHFDGKLEKVQGLLADMLKQRLNWGNLVSIDFNQETLQQCWSEWFHSRILHLIEQSQPYLESVAKFWRYSCENRSDQDELFSQYADTDFPGDSLVDLKAWKYYSELILTKKHELRKQGNAPIGFPAPSNTKDKELKKRYQIYKEEFKELLEQLSQQPKIGKWIDALKEISSFPVEDFGEENWQLIQSLSIALKLAMGNLQLLFMEKGEFDFSEISLRALQALGDELHPTDLSLRMDYQISHILVDEFQDTSHSQQLLLKQLTAGWQSEDQKTIFVVGDPMQSIYRFRAAEVSIFLEAWHQRSLVGIPVKPISLTANFRSHAEIVDWVNQAFRSIFPDQDDSQLGAVSYSPSQAMKKALNEDCIRIKAIAGKNYPEEATWICKQIKKLRSSQPEDSIAVLVSSKKHLQFIVSQMRQDNIAFEGIEIDPLDSKPEVQDLFSLTAALLDPSDSIHWLAVLRAPWCGLSLSDLTLLIEDQQYMPSQLEDLLQKLSLLSVDGQQRLLHFQSKISIWKKTRHQQNFVSWLQSLWLSLGGAGCYPNENPLLVLENVRIYFDLLDDLNRQQKINLVDIQTSLDRLFAVDTSLQPNPVMLMTMHKAKGLEFDHVFLPGLGRNRKHSDKDILVWMEWTRKDGHGDHLVAPIQGHNMSQNPFYNVIHDINKAKEKYEIDRLLYVATTRAKKKLFLSGHVNNIENVSPAARSLLAPLWEYIKYQFLLLKPDEAEINISSSYQQYRLENPIELQIHSEDFNQNGIKKLSTILFPEEFKPYFFRESEISRKEGIVFHKMVQSLADNINDIKKVDITKLVPVISQLLQIEGVSINLLDNSISRICELLKNMLNSKTGCWILSASHHQIKNEWQLTTPSPDQEKTYANYFIDRTFVDSSDTRWIIDYKTSHHQGGQLKDFLQMEKEKYYPQLQQYGSLVSQFEQRKIKLALYFPAMDEFIHWEYDSPELIS